MFISSLHLWYHFNGHVFVQLVHLNPLIFITHSFFTVLVLEDWTHQLNVFGLFNGTVQNRSSSIIVPQPLIPRPPNLVLQFDVTSKTGSVSTRGILQLLLQTPFLGWSTRQPTAQWKQNEIVYMEVSLIFLIPKLVSRVLVTILYSFIPF